MDHTPTPNITPDPIQARSQLIAQVVSRPDLWADFTALATLLNHPDLADPYTERLDPARFTAELHQIMARVALAHLYTFGRVDLHQMLDLLAASRNFSREEVAITMSTVDRVSDCINEEIVHEAMKALGAAA